MRKVAVIGAGAAGCFCAAQLRAVAPDVAVTVFEAGPKPLAKVAITGGGRCNLTNDFQGIRSLADAYPRGERLMKRALKVFSHQDTIDWFTRHGVPCVLQADHCWFPKSQDAMDIVHCLEKAMAGAQLRLKTPVVSVSEGLTAEEVQSLTAGENYFSCSSSKNQFPPAIAKPTHLTVNGEAFDFVVVTTGGAAKGLPFLEGLGLEMVPPVPSLFTFNIPDTGLKSLMGLVVEASIGLQGTPYKADGPLLITDWGFSGPATLKLSSYAARHLAETGYKGTVAINWLNKPESEVRQMLQESALQNPQKLISSVHPVQQRLWEHLIGRAGLRPEIRWAEIGSKGLNKLTATITNDCYSLTGKSKFREEFVTAGGVALSNINLNTLESKQHKGLFFAGEVLDIDAITGGFNLQAAWSTGFICAQSIANSL